MFDYAINTMLDKLNKAHAEYELQQEQAKEAMSKNRKYKDAEDYAESCLYWDSVSDEAEADYNKDKVQDAIDALREAYKAINMLLINEII